MLGSSKYQHVSLNGMHRYQTSVWCWFWSIQRFIWSDVVSLLTVKVRINALASISYTSIHATGCDVTVHWHSSFSFSSSVAQRVRDKMDVIIRKQGLFWSLLSLLCAGNLQQKHVNMNICVRFLLLCCEKLLVSNMQVEPMGVMSARLMFCGKTRVTTQP